MGPAVCLGAGWCHDPWGLAGWDSAEQGESGFAIAPTEGWGPRVIHRKWAGFPSLQYLAFWTTRTLLLVSRLLSPTSQALKPPVAPSPSP